MLTTKKKGTKTKTISLFILLLLFLFLGYTLPHKNQPKAPQDQMERLDSSVVLVQGNCIKAFTPPVKIRAEVLGVMFDGADKREWDSQIAYAVMMAESRGNPNKINWKDYHGSCWGSYGLFQLACFRGTEEELLNPETNTQIAYELWQREGWHPWSVFKSGKYLKFLN